jgi:hypothetical protein
MKRRGRNFLDSTEKGSQFMKVYLLSLPLSSRTTPNTPRADYCNRQLHPGG